MVVVTTIWELKEQIIFPEIDYDANRSYSRDEYNNRYFGSDR